ncbi:hypothetical protein STEG23_025429, partial [Scotinomys teguina]
QTAWPVMKVQRVSSQLLPVLQYRHGTHKKVPMLARADQKPREGIPTQNNGHMSLKLVEQYVPMVQLGIEAQERYGSG